MEFDNLVNVMNDIDCIYDNLTPEDAVKLIMANNDCSFIVACDAYNVSRGDIIDAIVLVAKWEVRYGIEYIKNGI